VGAGDPGTPPWTAWADPAPTRAHAGARHVGLAAWDAAVGYRHIAVGPALVLGGGGGGDRGPARVPRLADLAAAAAARAPAPSGGGALCAALAEVHRLEPALDRLRPGLAAALAARCPGAAEADPAALAALPPAAIAALLADPRLACDEERVLGIVLAWAGRGGDAGLGSVGGDPPPQKPIPDLESVLPLVRFPLMRPATLKALASSPLAASSAVLRALLGEAGRAQAAPGAAAGAPESSTDHPPILGSSPPPPGASSWLAVAAAGRSVTAARATPESLAAARHTPRPPAGGVDLLFMADGDANGVVHWAATAGGTRPHANPALAGALSVRASSPPCRHTHPPALVSGAASACNRAGPPPGGGGGWWEIDLGPGAALAVDTYSLRADASGDWPRSWALEASHDLTTWVVLKTHAADSSLTLPGQWASWPVAATRAACAPRRAFRVRSLGPHAGPGRPPLALALSGVELYGQLFVGGGEGGSGGGDGRGA